MEKGKFIVDVFAGMVIIIWPILNSSIKMPGWTMYVWIGAVVSVTAVAIWLHRFAGKKKSE